MFIFDSPVPSKHPSVAPYYARWNDMRKRCTSITLQDKNPTYKLVECCDEWKVFSSFKCWMEEQDWEGKQLDKDILVRDNKIYSPDRCLFVSPQVNTALLLPKENSNTLRGVSRCNGRYRAKIGNKHLGYFDSEGAAHRAWQFAKSEELVALAIKQEDLRIKNALLDRASRVRLDLSLGQPTETL